MCANAGSCGVKCAGMSAPALLEGPRPISAKRLFFSRLSGLDGAIRAQAGDCLGLVSQFGEDLPGVLAQHR